ncbi:putative leader peptide [Streptomyces radicis]|uniref:putative leader peptide n=1 Tax=Streptomyces radicis TaxID=1750517 RepID=UPI0039AF5000
MVPILTPTSGTSTPVDSCIHVTSIALTRRRLSFRVRGMSGEAGMLLTCRRHIDLVRTAGAFCS